MSIEVALSDLMQQTVQIKSCTGRDSWGAATYGASRSARCRITKASSKSTTNTGQEIVATTKITFPSSVTVDEHDQILLPVGWRNVSASGYSPVLRISAYSDETGLLHHTVVYL